MRSILTALLILFTMSISAQPAKYDTVAVMILDRMSDFIGELNACSYTIETSYDTQEPGLGLIKHFNEGEVFLTGPNKMLIDVRGDKGHRSYRYNGSVMVYYNYTENNFGTVAAPPTILETIDKINTDYGVEFPAADFFYPTFTDDLIASSERISYIGKKTIDGKECFHLAAHSKQMDIQLWIANDATNLPVRYVIVYNNDKEHVGQFEGTFANWQINPDLPNAMFEFTPPPSARKLTLIARTKK